MPKTDPHLDLRANSMSGREGPAEFRLRNGLK